MPAVMLAVVAVAGCRQPATDIPPATAAVTAPATDPLPSWREGANKQAILEYVRAVTTDGGPAYIPPASRFAIFDNDGTLWAEQPIVQLEFVAARIAALAREKPELAASPAVKALLARDLAFFHGKDGEKHAMELLALSSHRDVARVKARARARLADVDRRLEELQRVRSGLAALVEACPGHGRPEDCPILLALGGEDA